MRHVIVNIVYALRQIAVNQNRESVTEHIKKFYVQMCACALKLNISAIFCRVREVTNVGIARSLIFSPR